MVPVPDDDVPVVPSLLDRLVDEDPGSERDPAGTRSEGLRGLKRAIQRDLEALRNSRNAFFDLPAEFAEVGQSVVTFGLPDFSAVGTTSQAGQAHLLRLVEQAIRHFERRLDGVAVSQPPGTQNERTPRFRTDASIRLDQDRTERVAFDPCPGARGTLARRD